MTQGVVRGMFGERIKIPGGGPAMLAVLMGVPALFLLAHPYPGIYHDAIGYTLQALKHLEPDTLGGDLYFRFGSQDRFTVFSPAFAAVISHWGLEPAAHAVARVSSAALCASAWLLAARLMERQLAWLALALFIIIPGRYGAMHILSYSEDFATPRTLAEAVVLLSLAMAADGRRWLAVLVSLAAGFLHPLLALPGFLINLYLAVSRRLRLGLIALGVAAAAAITAVAQFAPVGALQFLDPEWRAVLISSTDYVFIDHWRVADWQPTVVALTTLVCVLLTLPPGRARELATAALAVGAAGIVLSAATARFAPVVLMIQGQPWRWIWAGKALSVLLLPVLGKECWRRGNAGRAAIALVAVAWAGSESPVGLFAAVSALLSVFFLTRGTQRSTTIVAWGSGLLAALLALALWRSNGNLAVAGVALAVIACWICAFGPVPPALRFIPVIAGAVLLSIQSYPSLAGTGTVDRAPRYDEAAYQAFAAWRDRISPVQTVLNPTRPEMTWLLLHRRSFAGYTDVMFSRDAALIAKDRERLMRSVFPELFSNPGSQPLATRALGVTAEKFRELCQVPELNYLVIREDLPYPFLASAAPPPFDGYRLYSCTDVRIEPAG